MFELLTQAIIILLLASLVVYIVSRLVPKPFLTTLGGVAIIALTFRVFTGTDNELINTLVRLILLPLTPLGFGILLLSWFLWRGIVGRLIWLPLFLLWVLSTPLIATQLAEVVEQRALEMADDTANRAAPTIVVLGNDTTRANLRPSPPNALQVQLSQNGEILYYAAQLYRWQINSANQPTRMIVSAGPRLQLKKDEDDNRKAHIEARDVREVLTNLAVPLGSIILEEDGDDIRESAEEVGKLLKEQSLGNNIALVTSALEIERAVKTFERELGKEIEGINVLARPTNFYTSLQLKRDGEDEDNQGREWQSGLEYRLPELFPSADALFVTSRIIREFLWTIYYFLRSWLN